MSSCIARASLWRPPSGKAAHVFRRLVAGNIRLPHSGGDVLESGQSCPELGRPVRVCVPSDKPDKGLSKQGQNRKRRDRPNSASLAQPGVVSGPPRSLNRLSNISPTSAETAQADLLTPLSSASVASQPSRLEVIKGFHGRREDFLKRLPKGSLYHRDNPQRSFTNLSGRCLESGAMLSRLILSRQLSNS